MIRCARTRWLTLDPRRQMFFNRVDQLGNADRLRNQWTSLDMKPALCLTLRDQRRYKNYRRVVQFTVGLNLRR